MHVTRKSQLSGIEDTHDLPITEEQMHAFETGTLVQKAFPHLTPPDREFILTGVTPEEWAKTFASGTRMIGRLSRRRRGREPACMLAKGTHPCPPSP